MLDFIQEAAPRGNRPTQVWAVWRWNQPGSLLHGTGSDMYAINLAHGRARGLSDEETVRRVVAVRMTGRPADAQYVVVEAIR